MILAAVGVVVVLVSIPELRKFVLHSNQQDACATLSLFAPVVFAAERESGAGLAAALALDPGLARRLGDARPLENGALFAFHGYYYALRRAPSGERVLYAWPCASGQTGVGAYAYEEGAGLFVHSNSAGRWSGLERRPRGAAPSSGTDGWMLAKRVSSPRADS